MRGSSYEEAGGSHFRILCIFFQMCLDMLFIERKGSSFPKVQRVLKATVMVIKCVTGANVSSQLAVCVPQLAN